MNVSRTATRIRSENSCSTLRRVAGVALAVATWALLHTGLSAQGPPPGTGQPIVLEGELDVLYEDGATRARLLYFLETVPRRVPLRFQGDGPDLPSGSRVRVAGNLAADGTVTPTTVTAIAVSPARTLGEQPVLVILFNFSNHTVEPYPASAAAAVNTQVRDFFIENSYQQTTMSFTVTGWHTITASNATCDYSSWASEADTAATNAGFNVSSYARRVYAFPQASACAWWGMGNVGGPRSWINGDYATQVVAHEQGHNFGDFHSRSESCDSIGCTVYEYGDDHDTMGSATAHLNAFQKERLGWLNYGVSPLLATISASGTYWVEAYESMGGGTKGLKILKSVDQATGRKTWYYLEVRAQIGFDSNVAPGVLVHTGSESTGNSSYQKDLAPSAPTFDSVLDVGQSFSDAAAGLTITTVSSDSTGAQLAVDVVSPPCVPSAPAVSLSPSQSPWMRAGSTFSYTVSVTSTDSATCAAAAFDLTLTMPVGWTASFLSPSLTLGPGSSASTTLQVTSASTATDGSYPVGVAATNAADPAKSGLASTTYVVLSSLTVQASTNQAIYSRHQTVWVTAKVWAGASIAAGASVTFTITKANGSAVTGVATTDVNGVAAYSLRLARRDPVGTYQASATAGLNSAGGSGATTFTVK